MYVCRYDGVKKESVLSGNRYELTAGSWMLVGHRLQVDMQRSKIGVGQHGSWKDGGTARSTNLRNGTRLQLRAAE